MSQAHPLERGRCIAFAFLVALALLFGRAFGLIP